MTAPLPALTQWVCVTDPLCVCSLTFGSCECTPVHGARIGFCAECREPMVLIDTDTGATVYAKEGS